MYSVTPGFEECSYQYLWDFVLYLNIIFSNLKRNCGLLRLSACLVLNYGILGRDNGTPNIISWDISFTKKNVLGIQTLSWQIKAFGNL